MILRNEELASRSSLQSNRNEARVVSDLQAAFAANSSGHATALVLAAAAAAAPAAKFNLQL